MTTIRRMSSMDDINSMIELGEIMHSESAYAHMPIAKGRMAAYGRNFIDDPTSGVGIVAEKDGQIVGMMVGWRTQCFFNYDIRAQDMLLYIHPKHRNGILAIRLVQEFEKWANEIGAKAIDIGITAGIRNETAIRLYSALGYRQIGAHLMKEI